MNPDTATRDARIATLRPLIEKATAKQRGALIALITDSWGMRVACAAADDDGGYAGDPPPPHIPDFFDPPLKFEDMLGNTYENWFDYIQAVTNGSFGEITGLDRDDWEPW